MKKLLLATVTLILSLNTVAQLNHFSDTTYHFAFNYPETWIPTGENSKNLRVVLVSPDEKFTLAAYGFFTEAGQYDLEKFADNDTLLFARLGKATDTKVNRVVPYIGKYLAIFVDGADEILDIRKKYSPNKNGYYAYAFFAVDEHYAYVLIAYSKSDDFSAINPVFNSFENTASWLTSRKNNFSAANLKHTTRQIIVWVIIFLYFSALMLFGRNFKKWSRRKNALDKFRKNLNKGEEPDNKWKNARRNASKKVWISVFLFIILWLPAVIINPTNWFVYVAVPGAFILGYLGYTLIVEDPS